LGSRGLSLLTESDAGLNDTQKVAGEHNDLGGFTRIVKAHAAV